MAYEIAMNTSWDITRLMINLKQCVTHPLFGHCSRVIIAVCSHFINSHFVNSQFVNSHLVNFSLHQFILGQFPFGQCWQSGNWQRGKLTKWELVKYIFKNSVMLSIWTRCWDAVDYVTDVLAIIHSMYCEELINNCGLALKVLSM